MSKPQNLPFWLQFSPYIENATTRMNILEKLTICSDFIGASYAFVKGENSVFSREMGSYIFAKIVEFLESVRHLVVLYDAEIAEMVPRMVEEEKDAQGRAFVIFIMSSMYDLPFTRQAAHRFLPLDPIRKDQLAPDGFSKIVQKICSREDILQMFTYVLSHTTMQTLHVTGFYLPFLEALQEKNIEEEHVLTLLADVKKYHFCFLLQCIGTLRLVQTGSIHFWSKIISLFVHKLSPIETPALEKLLSVCPVASLPCEGIAPLYFDLFLAKNEKSLVLFQKYYCSEKAPEEFFSYFFQKWQEEFPEKGLQLFAQQYLKKPFILPAIWLGKIVALPVSRSILLDFLQKIAEKTREKNSSSYRMTCSSAILLSWVNQYLHAIHWTQEEAKSIYTLTCTFFRQINEVLSERKKFFSTLSCFLYTHQWSLSQI